MQDSSPHDKGSGPTFVCLECGLGLGQLQGLLYAAEFLLNGVHKLHRGLLLKLQPGHFSVLVPHFLLQLCELNLQTKCDSYIIAVDGQQGLGNTLLHSCGQRK